MSRSLSRRCGTRRRSFRRRRMSSILVVLDTDGNRILESALPAVKFTQELAALWSLDFNILVLGGPEIAVASATWANYGARTVWCAADGELAHPTADRAAAVCHLVMEQSGSDTVVG